MLKMGFAPRPVPMMSLFTPTIPVIAPPYGSRADGELCVSTLKHSRVLLSKAITPALSWNTERRNRLRRPILAVVARMYVEKSDLTSRSLPSSLQRMTALKILCLQCSDQVWAIISSSTSVAAAGRPAPCRRCCTQMVGIVALHCPHLPARQGEQPSLRHRDEPGLVQGGEVDRRHLGGARGHRVRVQ